MLSAFVSAKGLGSDYDSLSGLSQRSQPRAWLHDAGHGRGDSPCSCMGSFAVGKQQEKGRREQNYSPMVMGQGRHRAHGGDEVRISCARSRCPMAGAGTGTPGPQQLPSPHHGHHPGLRVHRVYGVTSVLMGRQQEGWSPWESSRVNGAEVPPL